MDQQSHYPESFARNTVLEMKIIKLLVMRSGTYQPLYYRPYQTSFDAQTAHDLEQRMANHGPNSKVFASTIAGIANRIIMPKHQPEGIVPIVNGWHEPRGRFNMVLLMRHSLGGEFYYYIQGYTSHYDLSHGGLPDPNIEFYVNSYIRLNRTYQQTPSGLIEKDHVTESAQVINGRLVKSMLGTGLDIYGMRPNEMFSVMQAGQIAQDVWRTELQDNIRDPRHVFSTQNVPSARTNNLPANILANMIQSYKTGTAMLEFGQGRSDVFSNIKGYAYEGILMENPFFKALSDATTIIDSTSFTMGMLRRIDENVFGVTTFLKADAAALAVMNHAGQANYWHNPTDRLAWASTVLVQSVPTIMMEMMITRLNFTANNHDHGGHNRVDVQFARDIMGRPIADTLEVFKMRFVHEIMNDLTHGNQELYQLAMMIDLYGDTVVDISIGSEPTTRYVMPSFCDSMITPVVTTQPNLLHDNVHDMYQILKSVGGFSTGSQVNESI